MLEHHDGPLIPTCCNQEEDPMDNVPSFKATLTFLPGVDRNEISVVDNERYIRTSPWRRDEVGFRCTVEPLS